MNRNKTCCFSGHRRLMENETACIYMKIKEIITNLIENGVLYFGAGGALGFDTLAAQAVLELQKEHHQIKLILVLPCKEQTKDWASNDIEIYERIRQASDKTVYISEHYYNGCMLKRNRHLIEHSGYCVCYLTKNSGGTAYTVEYAKKEDYIFTIWLNHISEILLCSLV